MEARLTPGVRLRADRFGGVCYIPSRDDFFALDKPSFVLAQTLKPVWNIIPGSDREAIRALARIGLCETQKPATRQVAYSGPSFFCAFAAIVALSDPLVINCFATAYCPLICKYCHADDLMQKFREAERDSDLPNVVATASMIPAMVAVVTGGDPLTRPGRAEYLIRNLSKQKAVVLDTSGVGDLEQLLPSIVQYGVHVRVSLDSISEVNNTLRPINKRVVANALDMGSKEYAIQTIERCLGNQVPVTVQTVITSQNSQYDELRDLRDWLLQAGVEHWVLHICVPAGSARRFDQRARRRQRPLLITPSEDVYDTIKRLIDDTRESGAKLDIRCTDTTNTPNSVLLVASNGDLYTEGLAKAGKNRLFEAAHARPDLVRSLWYYIDYFGHARRYLNWNPRFYHERNLRDVSYKMPSSTQASSLESSVVETEGKYQVRDVARLREMLTNSAIKTCEAQLERDEYFDNRERSLDSSDFVVRVRHRGTRPEVSLKGPRHWAGAEYSRIELDIPGSSFAEVEEALRRKGLSRTWVFEKRREDYLWKDKLTKLYVDEIPECGFFLEIEGTLDAVRSIARALNSALGEQESRNYKELFLAFKSRAGFEPGEIAGAEFPSAEHTVGH